MPPSDLKITSGLALFDCQDHHAILGVPINSDQRVIRKRYLRIARMLHPDSVAEGLDKQTASTLLSKLVNPSYEFLSQPSQMEEYNLLLKLIGQRYTQEMSRYPLKTSEARDLLQAQDFQSVYQTQIETFAARQFEDLGQYLTITGALSEVNLVYLYRHEGAPAVASSSAAGTAPQPTTPASPRSSANPRTTRNPRTTGSTQQPISQGAESRSTQQPISQVSKSQDVSNTTAGAAAAESARTVNYDLVDQYCRRAEELIAKDCYLEAIRELKEVVEGNNPIDPNNSKVYTLLGNIYKDHMNQPVMARPFYTRALKADPNNAQAKRKLSEIAPSRSPANARGRAEPKDKKKSGFFSFLSRKK